MRCKRGAAHFEMIIAFVFFVGFTFFLFMVLTPQDTSILPTAVLFGLYDSFEEKVYTNLSEVLMYVNATNREEHFKIKLPLEIFSYKMAGGGSYVEDDEGNKVFSDLKITGAVVSAHLGINIDSNKEFFNVMLSPEFAADDIGGGGQDSDFSLGAVFEKRVVSYKALVQMDADYDADYESLKQELRVPALFDFAIVAIGDLSEIRMEPESGIPSSIEVLAKDYVFEILKEDGGLINERISFRVWR